MANSETPFDQHEQNDFRHGYEQEQDDSYDNFTITRLPASEKEVGNELIPPPSVLEGPKKGSETPPSPSNTPPPPADKQTTNTTITLDTPPPVVEKSKELPVKENQQILPASETEKTASPLAKKEGAETTGLTGLLETGTKKEEEKENKEEKEPKEEKEKQPADQESPGGSSTSPTDVPDSNGVVPPPTAGGADDTALAQTELLPEGVANELPALPTTKTEVPVPPPAEGTETPQAGGGRLTDMKLPELDGGLERMKLQDETILTKTEEAMNSFVLQSKTIEEEKITQLGSNEKKKEEAPVKLSKTKSAVEEKASEKKAEVTTKQVTLVAGIKPPEVKKEAAEDTLHKALDGMLPQKMKLEDVDKFKENKVASKIGAHVESTVESKTKEIEGTYEQLEKTEKPADPKKGTPLGGIESPTPTPTLNLGDKLIEPVAEEAVDLKNYKNESDNLLKKEGITEEQLKQVTTGDLAEANKLRTEVDEKVTKEPAAIRNEEKQLKEKSKADLDKKEQDERAKMRKEREGGLRGSMEKQKGTKLAFEKKKEEVTGRINGIYETANTKVQQKLDGLKVTAMAQFNSFETMASASFEDNVQRRKQEFKSKRYSGLDGAALWLYEILKTLDEFPQVQEILNSERANYIRSIDAAIAFITANSQRTIDECKAIIAQAKVDIATYVKGLDPEMKRIGKEAQGDIQKKLDALDEKVNKAAEELKEALAEKRKEAIAKIDKRIEEMRKEMAGALAKLGDLMADAALKFFEWAVTLAGYSMDDIMPFINKGKAILTAIVDDPGTFFSNMGAGIGGGISKFVDNAGEHLKTGLFDWLTGAMSGIPIVFPEKWDLQGIFSFISQVLGFGWETIKAKFGLAAGLDADKMAKVESAIANGEEGMEEVKKVKQEGLAGAMEIVQDKIAEAKETAISEVSNWAIMAIVKAAVPRVLLMLNPAGAIAQIIAAIVKTVIWFKDNFARIVKWANTVFDSVVDIAGGAVGAAAVKVEQSMAQAIPMILAFLAEQLGLGSVSKGIQDALEKIRKPVDKIVDRIVAWIVDKAKWLIKKIKSLFGKDKPQDPAANTPNPHAQRGPNDTEVGKDIGFTAGGERHHLWIDTAGSGVRVMVASTPTNVPDMLDKLSKEVKVKFKDAENKDKFDKANGLIVLAKQQHNKTHSDATLAEKEIKANTKDKNGKESTADADTERDENALKITLTELYELMGYNDGEGHGFLLDQIVKGTDYKLHIENGEFIINPQHIDVSAYVNSLGDEVDKDKKAEALSLISRIKPIIKHEVTEEERKQIVKDMSTLSQVMLDMAGLTVQDVPANAIWKYTDPKTASVEYLSYKTATGGSSPDVDVKGWDLLKDQDWVRMHLILDRVGGSGKVAANLVPGPKSVNSGQVMKSFEGTLRELFKKTGKGGKDTKQEVPVVMWIISKATGFYPELKEGDVTIYDDTTFAKGVSMQAGYYYPKGKDKWEIDTNPKLMQANIPIPKPDTKFKKGDKTIPNLNYIGKVDLMGITRNSKDTEAILKERDMNGLFGTIESFELRMQSKISKNVLNTLINLEVKKAIVVEKH